MIKPINQISGEVKWIRLLTQPRRARYSATSWVQVNLNVDGQPMVDYCKYNISLKELKKSLQGSGVYRIICCGCGDTYCDAHGELIVRITHHKNTIEWRNNGQLPRGYFHFSKSHYQLVVKQLEVEVKMVSDNINETNHGPFFYKASAEISAYPIDLLETS